MSLSLFLDFVFSQQWYYIVLLLKRNQRYDTVIAVCINDMLIDEKNRCNIIFAQSFPIFFVIGNQLSSLQSLLNSVSRISTQMLCILFEFLNGFLFAPFNLRNQSVERFSIFFRMPFGYYQCLPNKLS